MINNKRSKFLYIEDPFKPQLNVAHLSYLAPNVKCAFEYAFII